MKICGRCDQSIAEGEPYTAYDILRPTGPGITVYQHDKPCPRVEIQTTQDSIRH